MEIVDATPVVGGVVATDGGAGDIHDASGVGDASAKAPRNVVADGAIVDVRRAWNAGSGFGGGSGTAAASEIENAAPVASGAILVYVAVVHCQDAGILDATAEAHRCVVAHHAVVDVQGAFVEDASAGVGKVHTDGAVGQG